MHHPSTCTPGRQMHLKALVLVSAMGAGTPALAFDVLGCSYGGGNPNDFVRCINNSANSRVNDTKRDGEQKAARLQGDIDKLKRERDERAAAVRHEIEDGPLFAKGQAEAKILAAAHTLQLDALFQCLASSGALEVMAADVDALKASPAEFFTRLQGRVEQQLDGVRNDRLRPALQALLQADRLPSRDFAVALTQQFAADLSQRVPGLRCLDLHLAPAAPNLRIAALGQANLMDQKQVQLSAQIRTLLEDKIREGLQARLQQGLAAADGLATWLAQKGLDIADVDADAIVHRAFVRRILWPAMDRARPSVEALATALRARPALSSAEITRLQSVARDNLQADPRMKSAALIEIGAHVTRDLGSTVITSDFATGMFTGKMVIDAAGYVVTVLENVGKDGACGAAGLAPEVGAGICSAARNVVTATTDWAKLVGNPVFKLAVTKAVDGPWRAFMNDLRDTLIADDAAPGGGRMQQLRNQHPQFATLTQTLDRQLLMRVGGDYLQQLERALGDYQTTVASLVAVAGR
jgi:hypothetical protein